jgi:hypothetical protein
MLRFSDEAILECTVAAGPRKNSVAAASTATTTTTPATIRFGEIFVVRDAAELKGHGNKLADFALDTFQLALSIHEINGNLVVKQRVTGTLEFANLGGAQLDPGVLLLMQRFAAIMHGLVLKLGRIVREKFLHDFLKFIHALVVGEFGTEFQSGIHDSRFAGKG